MRRNGTRFWAFLAALTLVLSLALPALPVPARAASSSLTVKAGYFGLPYATKAEYSAAEVEALGIHSALYTMNTNGGFLGYANGEGVYLKDLLSSAGVNTGSINYVNFMAADGHHASKNYYYNTLFGTRYAFPDLSKYYGQLEGVTDADAVWESAVTVKTMLAVRDNYARVDDFSEYAPGDMTSSHRFRLLIGQTYPGEVVASDSIYEVNTVIVTYVGSPQIDAESDVSISIDEDHTLVYSVSSADSAITQMISQGLKFKSSDESIVSVDENGRLTAKREGEVEITIYYESTDIDADDIFTTVRVKVGGGTGSGGDGTGDGLGDGTGSGSGTGEAGTGQGGGEGNTPEPGGSDAPGSSGDRPAENTGSDDTQKPSSDGQVSQVTPEEPDETPVDVYISDTPQPVRKDHTLRVRRVQAAGAEPTPAPAPAPGSSNSGAEGGSEALGLKLDNTMMLLAAILAAAFFLGGGAGMYIEYRKEI